MPEKPKQRGFDGLFETLDLPGSLLFLSIFGLNFNPAIHQKVFFRHIIEDQIVLREGDISLPPGDSMTLAEMALGGTWRIEAEQGPFHPGFSTPTAVLEGCGGLLSTGFFNQLPLDDADPFVEVDCRQIIGSGTLKIAFSNIHLPDSNINEAASHGFVRFRIAQKPGLPNGSIIPNEAGIFSTSTQGRADQPNVARRQR